MTGRKIYKLSNNMITACTEEEIQQDIALEHISLDLEEFMPHEDFIKVFRLARLLEPVKDLFDDVKVQVGIAYCSHLGYEMTDKEYTSAIKVWSERFEDVDDDELDGWVD